MIAAVNKAIAAFSDTAMSCSSKTKRSGLAQRQVLLTSTLNNNNFISLGEGNTPRLFPPYSGQGPFLIFPSAPQPLDACPASAL